MMNYGSLFLKYRMIEVFRRNRLILEPGKVPWQTLSARKLPLYGLESGETKKGLF
jgi:hypothetical protein